MQRNKIQFDLTMLKDVLKLLKGVKKTKKQSDILKSDLKKKKKNNSGRGTVQL